jgi:hypothetical protein
VDANILLSSLKSTLALLLTSSAFRLIFSSLLTTAREIIAAIASDVEGVAEKVQVGAEHVERAAKFGDVNLVINEVQSTVQDAVEDTGEVKVEWTEFFDANLDKDEMKDVILTRMQEVSMC